VASFRNLCLATAGFSFLLAAPSKADVVVNISTGYDNAVGDLLPNGAPDKYQIGVGGSGGYYDEIPVVRTAPLPGGWLRDDASSGSRWLVLDTGMGLEGVNAPGGTYFFDVWIELTGYDASTARITGLQYAADNKLVGVEVNGITVFSQDTTFAEEFGAFHLIGDVGLDLFEDGLNLIRFIVYNQEGFASPMGLRLEALVEADPAGNF
jgi:hypothetical protein